MKNFKGKVAVVTGAANGIGFEICKKCANLGMSVVMADIDMKKLEISQKEIEKLGAKTLAVKCDVSEFDQFENLAKVSLEKFGSVHMLFNNAGVSALGDIISMPERDWNFCINIDLYGPYYGMKIFLPILEAQNEECYIVNTASGAGLFAVPGMPAYYAAKFGVVGLSESIYTALKLANSNVGLTVLCPGLVKTDFNNCDSRRPEKYAIDPNDPYYSGEVYKAGKAATDNDVSKGLSPEFVVEKLFEGIQEEQLYVLVVDEVSDQEAIEKYLLDKVNVIMGDKNPDLSIFEEFLAHGEE